MISRPRCPFEPCEWIAPIDIYGYRHLREHIASAHPGEDVNTPELPGGQSRSWFPRTERVAPPDPYAKGAYTLVLDEYERANLISLLNAIGYGLNNDPRSASLGRVLGPLNTGDWVGQIYNKITKVPCEHKPNSDGHELRKAVWHNIWLMISWEKLSL